MDPFLLCAWALEGGRPREVVDLGTGSGIMALLMAHNGIPARGYDVRPEWIRLASRSAADSGLDVRFELADMRSLEVSAVDLALLNPPYLTAGQGSCSPDPWKAAARTELNGGLAELVAAGARVARRLCLVLRADRADECLTHLVAAGLTLSRRCDIDGSLVLLEGRVGQASLVVERASMRGPDGAWSPRVSGWYRSLGARLS